MLRNDFPKLKRVIWIAIILFVGAYFIHNYIVNRAKRQTKVGEVIWHISWVDKKAKKEKGIMDGIMDPAKSDFLYEIDNRLLGDTFAPPIFAVGDIFLFRIMVQESGGSIIRLEVVNSETKEPIKMLMDEIVPQPKELGGGTAYLRSWQVEPGTYPTSVKVRLTVGTVLKEKVLFHRPLRYE